MTIDVDSVLDNIHSPHAPDVSNDHALLLGAEIYRLRVELAEERALNWNGDVRPGAVDAFLRRAGVA